MSSKGGPKTPKGKLISSQNALKHGVTSKKLLNPDEQDMLDYYNNLLIEEHKPDGITENLLIKDLAMIRVRLERFDAVETSLFAIEQANSTAIETLEQITGIKLGNLEDSFIEKLQNNTHFSAELSDDERNWCKEMLKHFNMSPDIPSSVIDQIKNKLQIECLELNTDPDGVREHYYLKIHHTFDREIWQFSRPDTKEQEKENKEHFESSLNSQKPRELYRYLTLKLEADDYVERKNQVLNQFKLYADVMKNAAMPEQKELDRLYRYRTTLEKNFSTKLSQLVQLQEIKAKKARIKAIQN